MAKTPTLTKEQRAARKRLLTDFEFWAKHSCTIRTKAGEVTPLIFNKVQRRFLKRLTAQEMTTGIVRFVILKGRQQGFSTLVSAYNYFKISQNKGKKGIVIAHVKDSTQTLFDMYDRIHDNIPDMLKQPTKYSSRRELVFEKLDSGLMVATAGGKSIARGETLQYMHLSEVAFWPKTFAEANFNGLIQALPDVPNTAAFIESTANGVTGKFYEMWQDAVAGTNGYEPFFAAWYESHEYREEPPPGFTRTPEEQKLMDEHGHLGLVDDAQLYWRRRKIATSGSELFKQEYPFTADEAFITSGRPVFHTEILTEMKARAEEPIRRMAVEPVTNDLGKIDYKVMEHPRGELHVYHERQDNETYYIGVDVAVGIRDPEKADWSVAQILDSHKRQVAMWRGQVTPDHLARVLNTLGYFYNHAMIAPERNGHGLLVCVRLWKDLNYGNCFLDLKEGEMADRESLAIGFQTNVASKPLIIDKLRGEVRERQIEINDHTTLSEMLTFVVTESGKMEAEQGRYDDTVMALAIANHIHEGRATPVEVLDEFYSEAI